ncbi:hypothetical protein [Streptomyces misionensis]
MLHDTDDEVARTAWRVAVVLVPEEGRWSVNWSWSSVLAAATCS